MDKKNLPVDILICSGAGLLASFLPWIAGSGVNVPGFGYVRATGFASGWNATIFGIPTVLSVLALVAIGVFALLKANGQWKAPPQLNIGLAILGCALPLLLILVWFGRAGANGGVGAYLAAAAGGYLTYLFLGKKEGVEFGRVKKISDRLCWDYSEPLDAELGLGVPGQLTGVCATF